MREPQIDVCLYRAVKSLVARVQLTALSLFADRHRTMIIGHNLVIADGVIRKYSLFLKKWKNILELVIENFGEVRDL